MSMTIKIALYVLIITAAAYAVMLAWGGVSSAYTKWKMSRSGGSPKQARETYVGVGNASKAAW